LRDALTNVHIRSPAGGRTCAPAPKRAPSGASPRRQCRSVLSQRVKNCRSAAGARRCRRADRPPGLVMCRPNRNVLGRNLPARKIPVNLREGIKALLRCRGEKFQERRSRPASLAAVKYDRPPDRIARAVVLVASWPCRNLRGGLASGSRTPGRTPE
jgi:hypothetical protein